MKLKYFFIIVVLTWTLVPVILQGQQLKPGFDKAEYREMLLISARTSANPETAMHTGWLICTAYLSRDILPRIDSLYKTVVKDFIITGHSQGGAISYLLTAYFINLREQKVLPTDLRIKTYCSAAPKPGNLYFAYDYEARTQSGWAFNVVNTADWVPESPFSVQTTGDYYTLNPFSGIRPKIKKMEFPQSTVIMHTFTFSTITIRLNSKRIFLSNFGRFPA